MAVQEALRLGVTAAAAVTHILRMPDADQRRRYEIALSEELAQFERPQYQTARENPYLLMQKAVGACRGGGLGTRRQLHFNQPYRHG